MERTTCNGAPILYGNISSSMEYGHSGSDNFDGNPLAVRKGTSSPGLVSCTPYSGVKICELLRGVCVSFWSWLHIPRSEKNKVVLMRSLMLMLMSNFGIGCQKGGRSSTYPVNSCLNGVQRGMRFGLQQKVIMRQRLSFGRFIGINYSSRW